MLLISTTGILDIKNSNSWYQEWYCWYQELQLLRRYITDVDNSVSWYQ